MMFCSECGSQADGKYCWNCGHSLTGSHQKTVQVIDPPIPQDWSNEHRYEVLLKVPEVRQLIERHAAQAIKQATGEQFLEFCDVAFKPLMGGVGMVKLAAIIQPLYASWGVSTGKTRTAQLSTPIGHSIVCVLCSLARHGQTVKHVEQADDGCVIQALLPSDLWALAGELFVTVARTQPGTHITAATKIGGQWYDWGKSQRRLETLFSELAGGLPR